MKDKHITSILDDRPLAAMSASDLEAIRAHVLECGTCNEAYQAAQLSQLLVKDRAAAEIEPSPFFQTRVMAAWREQQASGAFPVFSRWWKSAGALVSSLALTTAALAVFSFTIPESATESAEETSAAAESIVLEGVETEENLTEEQMLSAMYVDDEGTR